VETRPGAGDGSLKKCSAKGSRNRPSGRLLDVMPKRSFETLVTDHGATVLRVCLAVLGPADADDAWSETFLSALKAYPELPADANVEAWLVTIAHRKAIDIVRATNRRPQPVGEVPESAAPPTVDSPDLDLIAALEQLPPRQRQAVAYHYLAGLPYREIAAIVGGTTDAARRAAADGIAALRRTHPNLTSRHADPAAQTRGVSR
jgi:RNA polymerase sigma factor (sigma-70 family)